MVKKKWFQLFFPMDRFTIFHGIHRIWLPHDKASFSSLRIKSIHHHNILKVRLMLSNHSKIFQVLNHYCDDVHLRIHSEIDRHQYCCHHVSLLLLFPFFILYFFYYRTWFLTWNTSESFFIWLLWINNWIAQWITFYIM